MDSADSHDRSGRTRIWRGIAWALLALLAVLAIVPLVWPVPEIPGALDAADLAGPDSSFIEAGGIE
ncbi:MAG: hypothetical protein IBX63_09555, partial [Coriobacteriia bacterium]|nr:hypothetical protein [Coriobacteriia bacterium]